MISVFLIIVTILNFTINEASDIHDPDEPAHDNELDDSDDKQVFTTVIVIVIVMSVSLMCKVC